MACRGELSSDARNSNIEAFKRRRAFADHEITALNGHIRFASPAVKKQFAETLTGLMAAEFKAANNGKWTGDVAIGLTAGQILGDIVGG